MARIARVVAPGNPHFVYQGGQDGQDIFFSDKDYELYIKILSEQAERFSVQISGYCLMKDQVNLILTPKKEDGLSRMLGETHRMYSRSINQRVGREVVIFQGRFLSCPLDKSIIDDAVRMVERTPSRESVGNAATYKWSSAKYHCGKRKTDPLAEGADVGATPDKWTAALKKDPELTDTLLRHVRTGRPIGPERFIKRMEKRTGKNFHVNPAGRPSKKKK